MENTVDAQLHDILKSRFGYDSFRDGQIDVIKPLVEGNDVFGIFQTGFGKSMVFQVAGLYRGGVTIVISPLISLMQDQVYQLKNNGIRAVALNSTISPSMISNLCVDIKNGLYSFVYMSPERLKSAHNRNTIKKWDVRTIVVDECHCVSQWGFDFRPEFLKIHELRTEMGIDAPICAMTATANAQVKSDVVTRLKLKDDHMLFENTVNRTNLNITVKNEHAKLAFIHKFVRENHPDSCGIVYVDRRLKTESIKDFLNKKGFSAENYNGGMGPDERFTKQNRWIKGDAKIMIATNAFGMGIDKADVRFVIHYDLPGSLEQYVQEVGRAGRDGLDSDCIMLYSDFDIHLQRKTASHGVDGDALNLVHQYIKRRMEGKTGVLPLDVTTVKIPDVDHAKFMACMKFMAAKSLISIHKEKNNLMEFCLMNKRNKFAHLCTHSDDSILLFNLFRTNKGKINSPFILQEDLLVAKSGSTAEVWHRLKNAAAKEGLITYHRRPPTMLVSIHEKFYEEENLKDGIFLADKRSDYKEYQKEKLVNYIVSRDECRKRTVLKYFDETLKKNCEMCDVCLSQK